MIYRAEKLTQAEKDVIAKIEEARKALKYNSRIHADGGPT